jgi:hypothetical protein
VVFLLPWYRRKPAVDLHHAKLAIDFRQARGNIARYGIGHHHHGGDQMYRHDYVNL